MRIALTGASGFIGRAVIDAALRRGHEVVAFSRSPHRVVEGTVETRRFSLEAPLDVEGCDAVVHLAGEPIAGIWTAKKQRDIMISRVRGTRQVVEGIARASHKPEVLVSASGVGVYADGGDAELSEDAPKGRGLLAETGEAWEAEAFAAQGTRVVALRIAPVLGLGGGALRLMVPVFKLGLGGAIGSGQQWMPWIHLEDLARLFLFAVEDMAVSGPINACSPWPVRNEDFTRTLARVLRRPAFFRVPAVAVRAALRGLAVELLESKRVVPTAATDRGFGFQFPELERALRDLLG